MLINIAIDMTRTCPLSYCHTLDDKQYQSIYNDAEELVKILVARCKKLNEVGK